MQPSPGMSLSDALGKLNSSEKAMLVTEAAPPFPITHVNDAWERLCGFTAAEAVGHTCRIIQGRLTDSVQLIRLREAVLAHKAVSLQLVNYRKDGTPFRNDLELEPVALKGGAPTHYVGTLSPSPIAAPPHRTRRVADGLHTLIRAASPVADAAAGSPDANADEGAPGLHGRMPREIRLRPAAAHARPPKRLRTPASHEGTPPSHVAVLPAPERSAAEGDEGKGAHSTGSRGDRAPKALHAPPARPRIDGTGHSAVAPGAAEATAVAASDAMAAAAAAGPDAPSAQLLEPLAASPAAQDAEAAAHRGWAPELVPSVAVGREGGGGCEAMAVDADADAVASGRSRAGACAVAAAACEMEGVRALAPLPETREVINADLSHFAMPLSLEAALRVTDEVLVVTEATRPFRVVHVNEAWTDICGFSRDEMVGQSCSLLQGPGTCSDVLRKLERAVESGQSITVMLLNYTKERRPFMNLLCVSPLEAADGGPPRHYVGISRPQFLAPLMPTMERVIASLMPQGATQKARQPPEGPNENLNRLQADKPADALDAAGTLAGWAACDGTSVQPHASTDVVLPKRAVEDASASLARTAVEVFASRADGLSSQAGLASSRAGSGAVHGSEAAAGALTDPGPTAERVRVAPFVAKLYDMVCSAPTDACIHWAPGATAFVIPDPDRFASEVLPRYFKHNQLSSFTQQLSTYAFSRVPNESCLDQRLVYSHPSFSASQGRATLHLIRRTHKMTSASQVRGTAQMTRGGAEVAHAEPPPDAGAAALPITSLPDKVLVPEVSTPLSWISETEMMLTELEERFNRTKEQHILAEERLEMMILQIAKKLVTRSANFAGRTPTAHNRDPLGAQPGDKAHAAADLRPEPMSTASAQVKRSGSEPGSGRVGSGGSGSGGLGSGGSGSGGLGSGGSGGSGSGPSGGSGSKDPGSEGDGSGGEGSE